MRDIGKNIRDLRESKGLTQEEMAARLFVTRQTVSNYETGKTRPDVDMILRIAEVLDADANTVFYGRPVDDRKRRIISAVILAVVTAALWALQIYLRGELMANKLTAPTLLPLWLEEMIFKTAVMFLVGVSIMKLIMLSFKGAPIRARWVRIVKIIAIVLTAVACAAVVFDVLCVFFAIIGDHDFWYWLYWYSAKLNTEHPWVYVVLGAALAGFSLKKPENASQGDASCKPQ
jgi:transcriptional regulator with XRE-family HTH domain